MVKLNGMEGDYFLKESIHNYGDLLQMLDQLLKEQAHFNWNNF